MESTNSEKKDLLIEKLSLKISELMLVIDNLFKGKYKADMKVAFWEEKARNFDETQTRLNHCLLTSEEHEIKYSKLNSEYSQVMNSQQELQNRCKKLEEQCKNLSQDVKDKDEEIIKLVDCEKLRRSHQLSSFLDLKSKLCGLSEEQRSQRRDFEYALDTMRLRYEELKKFSSTEIMKQQSTFENRYKRLMAELKRNQTELHKLGIERETCKLEMKRLNAENLKLKSQCENYKKCVLKDERHQEETARIKEVCY